MIEPFLAAEGLVRVYPGESPSGVGLVWIHGGAFAYGDLDMPESDWVARQLEERGISVVTVDYRLAPAMPNGEIDLMPASGWHYPAASDDVVSAFEWASGSGLAEQWAIGGASAGGNLAVGATLRLCSGGGTVPSLVVLAYPTLLAVQPPPGVDLRQALDNDPAADVFGPVAVKNFYENYLGFSADSAPLVAVPGRATVQDLRDFPRTVIVNSDVDELRVSSEIFAATLQSAGRDVSISIEPGTTHGHLNRPEEVAAKLTTDYFAAQLLGGYDESIVGSGQSQ